MKYIYYKMFEKQQQVEEEGAYNEKFTQNTEKSEAESIYYTRNKKIIFWLYLFLGAVFVAIQIYLTSLNWDQMELFSTSDNLYYANQVTYQWSQGYINDVVITSDSTCPTGYEQAFEYYWPGTGFGCYCPVDSNNTFVLQGYCSARLIQSKCVNIKSESEKFANFWKQQSNICVKRSVYSFLNEEKYEEKKNKLCGNSKSLVVLPLDQPCPLVNLSFTIPALEENYRVIEDTTNSIGNLYATFNSTSPYSFNGYPISKFKVSEYQFCLIDEDTGLDPNHVEFKLLNYEKGCTNTSRFQILDEIKESQFYASNPQLNALSDKLGFQKPGNWAYKLGFASLPSWNYYCRHNYDSKFSMARTIDVFNFDFFDQYYYISLAEVILCVIIGFQIFILGFRRIMNRQVYPIGYRKQYLPGEFCSSLIRFIIDALCKLSLLGLIGYSTVISMINWDWFKSAINLQCTDSHQEMRLFVMQPFRDMYTFSVNYTIGQFTVIIVVAIIDVMHFFYVYNNEITYYLVNSQRNKLVKHESLSNKDNELEKEQYNIEKQIVDIEDKVEDHQNKSDKFRITMAFNVFENQSKDNDREVSPERSRPIKNKKKKKGLFKRQKNPLQQSTMEVSHDFNPYSLEDQSMIGMNSRDQLASNTRNYENPLIIEDIEQDIVRSRRKKRRGKK